MAIDWKDIVSTVAPVLGTALGGPYGAMAAKCLVSALGLKEDATDRDIARAAAGNPEFALKAREADSAFKLRMRECDIQEDQLAYADRDSARKREVAVKDKVPALLALTITVGFFGVLIFLVRYGVPTTGGGEALLVMLGALGAAFTGVVQYYFGSSAGSARKTDLLGKSANG